MKPLIVNCHTGELLYKDGFERMKTSAEMFGYEVYGEVVECKGSWFANIASKATFLLKCAEQTDRPIVWVDADSEIIKELEFFEEVPYEFAIAWDPAFKFSSFQSAVMYWDIRAPRTMDLLRSWEEDSVSTMEGKDQVFDQTTLYHTWLRVKKIPITKILPQGYVKVFNHGWRSGEDKVEYVRQHQFSRQIRKIK